MCTLKYDFGTCGACNYSVEELLRDYPNGSGGEPLDASAILVKVPNSEEQYLVVMPHRTNCPFSTQQKVL